MTRSIQLVAVFTGVALVAGLHAQQAPLERLPVRGQVSLVSNGGTNAVLQIGSQGVLVVDPLGAELADPLIATIRAAAGTRPIAYVINTHAHPEQTSGNEKVAAAGSQQVAGNFAAQLGGAGAKGAFIVAHENALLALSAPTGSQPALPVAAWPTETFFQAEKAMYFNGEGIQLSHIPNAHTDGDILVFFRSSDVIAAGDIYDTTAFPRIDEARKGSIAGVIEGLNRLIDLAISEQFTEGGTRIVPGRGRISDEFDVVEYRDMVTIVRDRVQGMKAKRMTLDQVTAARPAFEYEPRFAPGAPQAATAFIESIYRTVR